MSKLLLVDGNSLTYRAFFALPTEMTTASGQVTNAVFGFFSMLTNLFRDHDPQEVAVAFDLPGPTFRHEKLSSYKGNREKQPDILYQQLSIIKEILQVLGIQVVEKEGFEADDVIATLATRSKINEQEVLIITGDRDAYQLVEDPYVRVLYNKRGVSEYSLYNEGGIEEKTGVNPTQYVDYAALRGDNSDNLPGVPGIGDKTAAKLINKYGGLDGIFFALEEQTPKLFENLKAHEKRARLNVELMTLVRDVPIDQENFDFRVELCDLEKARELFGFFELNTIRDRLGEVLGIDFGAVAEKKVEELETLAVSWVTCENETKACETLKSISSEERSVSFYASTSPNEEELLGLAINDGSKTYWFSSGLLESEKVRSEFQKSLNKGGLLVSTHDAKRLLKLLYEFEITVDFLNLDTALAAYLIEPSSESYELVEIFERYTDLKFPEIGSVNGQLDFEGENSDPVREACCKAAAINLLVPKLKDALKVQELLSLNDEIEVPLVAVLAKMEQVGIGVDVAELTRLRDELALKCEQLRETIYQLAGTEFNVNSTKQLREVLFEKLALTPGRKTKTGYSTDAATLERLRSEHAVVDELLAYREVEKLRSTYGEGLLTAVNSDDRIRATFHQTVTRTGRLSSDAPNLHNIPVRTESGRAFRQAFIPATGYTLLVADYNQIELRCIAHLSEDVGLLAAFHAGDDVHTAVASKTWNVNSKDVTPEMRNRAKMVAYGLAYGMESYGLAQRLDISTEEASEILNSYFGAFPGVRDYMERSVHEAREKGYTETLLKRRRRIPELESNNFNIRQAGERQAMNAPIQGLAADIFKIALVGIHRRLISSSLNSRLVLQVHDEVILEVADDEVDIVRDLVTSTMEGAFDLKVDLAVEIASGNSWANAKS